MEPLSAAGSIAGLVSIGDVVLRKLYHYVDDARNAEKQVESLQNEVAALNGVLHSLYSVAQELEAGSTFTYSIRLDHVSSCLGTLHKLEDELNKNGFSDKRKVQKMMRKLTWPFKAINIKKFIEEIHRHRDNLGFALSADSMTGFLKCLSIQADISKQIIDIETRLRNKEDVETRITLDKKEQEILDHFLPVNPQPNFRTSVKLRYPTTGFWLKDHEAFSKWMDGSSTNLWLSGIPGAGKTVLSGLVIEECLARTKPERAVAFFYCDYNNSQSQIIANILSALVSQIARQNKESFRLLNAFHDQIHPQNQLKRDPEVDELVELFHKMSSIFEDVRIIVDGLDECGDKSRPVSRVLKSLATDDGSTSLALLSRDEVDIREELSPPSFQHIEIAAQSKDLNHYVRTEIEQRIKEKRLRLRNPQLKEEITTQLVGRANGMFRWVSCQLDLICELPTDKARRKALQQLPETLPGTYARFLLRLKEHDIPWVRKLLQWIAYSQYRLSLDELVDVLSLDEEDGTLDPEARIDPEDVFRLCGSLIRRADMGPELAHFTVLEFLEGIQPDDTKLSKLRLCRDDRLTLAKTCTRYLCAPSFGQVPPTTLGEYQRHLINYPFYGHAASEFLNYSRGVQCDKVLFRLLQVLFRPGRTYNLMIAILYNMAPWYQNPIVDIMKNVYSPLFSSLHAASMLSVPGICKWLITEHCNVNMSSPIGTPLILALFGPRYAIHKNNLDLDRLAFSECQDTIALLVDTGANLNMSISPVFGVLAVHGTKGGTSSILANLLKRDVWKWLPPSTIDSLAKYSFNLRSFLKLCEWTEAQKPTPAIQVQLLELAKVENVNIPINTSSMSTRSDEVFRKSIFFAVEFQQLGSFEDLTKDLRFTVDMTNSNDGTLLHHAAKSHSLEIISNLLDLGATTTVTDSEGCIPLHYVNLSNIEDEDLLRRLITSLPTGVKNNLGHTVWHNAARSGALRALELLIEIHGKENSELNASCNARSTPFLQAVFSKHEKCAILLYEAAHPGPTAITDWRYLHYSVALGLSQLYRRILDSGFNPGAVSEDKRTALYFLTSSADKSTVEFLLHKGLSPDHRDINKKTPLHSVLDFDLVGSLGPIELEMEEVAVTNMSIYHKLVTPSSATSQDSSGHTVWYYFCTRMVPYILDFMQNAQKCMTDLLSTLERHNASKAYETATIRSGVSLFIEMLLDTVDKTRRILAGATYSSRYLEKPRDPVEKQDIITSVLLHYLASDAYDTYLPTKDPQSVRLLLWSSQVSQTDLVQALLQLGVNVHSSSRYYASRSAIALCCTSQLDPIVSRILLEKVDVERLSETKDEDSPLWHDLCGLHPYSELGEALKILEALLEKGLNVNATVRHTERTAAHVAASSGHLECLKLLFRFGADLKHVDSEGWGILACGVTSRCVPLISFLHDNLQDEQHWIRTFRIEIQCRFIRNTLTFSDCNLFHLAVCQGESEILQLLTDTGYFRNIEAKTKEGLTALHFAVYLETASSVNWLINEGANVNAIFGPEKTSALHIAMEAGDLKVITALVEAGAHFTPDYLGTTPEMMVAPGIRETLFQILLHCGVQIPPSVMENLKFNRQKMSRTDFFNRIRRNDVEACQRYIRHGGSLETPFECGNCTPLILALNSRSLAVVDVLLEHRASTMGNMGECDDSHLVHELKTALNIAICNPDMTSRLDSLLDVCLDYAQHWTLSPLPPLHVAAAFNPMAIEAIIEHVKKHACFFGLSVESASESAPRDVISALLKQRHDANSFGDIKWLVPRSAALHIAAWNRQPDAIRALLSYGAEIDAPNDLGKTPLHLAATSGCITTTKLLLQNGAKRRSRDIDLLTPFMMACRVGAEDIVVELMEPRLDVCLTDNMGQTALHQAAQSPNIKVFIYLIQKGWDPYQEDLIGKSSLFYALSNSIFATYVFASGLDLTQLRNPIDREAFPGFVWPTLRRFRLRCPQHHLQFMLQQEQQSEQSIEALCAAAADANISYMECLLHAGAKIDSSATNKGSPLITACLAGQMASVAFLIRRGAKLESTLHNRPINAFQAAQGNAHMVHWLFVGRYVDQDKITSTDCIDQQTTTETKRWSGARAMQVPLRGKYQRKAGQSLFEHLKSVWEEKDAWERMVPLSWKPTEHFIPTLAEIQATESSDGGEK